MALDYGDIVYWFQKGQKITWKGERSEKIKLQLGWDKRLPKGTFLWKALENGFIFLSNLCCTGTQFSQPWIWNSIILQLLLYDWGLAILKFDLYNFLYEHSCSEIWVILFSLANMYPEIHLNWLSYNKKNLLLLWSKSVYTGSYTSCIIISQLYNFATKVRPWGEKG